MIFIHGGIYQFYGGGSISLHQEPGLHEYLLWVGSCHSLRRSE